MTARRPFSQVELTPDADSGAVPSGAELAGSSGGQLLLDIEERPLNITRKVDQNDPKGLFQPWIGRVLESRSNQSLSIF